MFPKYETIEDLCNYGYLWRYEHDTLEAAVMRFEGRYSGRGVTGELHEVVELVEGVKSTIKLADVVSGEWFIQDRRLTMAKIKEAAAKGKARNVAADLLGDDQPSKGKVVKGAAKPNGKAATTKPVAAKKTGGAVTKSAYEPTQSIKVVKKMEYRDGSTNAKVYAMLQKSATIKDFLKLRVKAGLDNNVGGVFKSFVKEGIVKVK